MTDAQGAPFPVIIFLGPCTALLGLAMLANCAFAVATCRDVRRRGGFADAYDPTVFRRVCCGLSNQRRDTNVIIVIKVLGGVDAIAAPNSRADADRG